jgi:NAD(P)H-dependent FMN reductase
MKICIISSSLAEHSHSRLLADFVNQKAQAQNMEVTFWDLRTRPIRTLVPEFHHETYRNKDPIILNFLDDIAQSDIVILTTPVYHGSYSGSLKMALDQLSKDALKGKLVGFVCHGHNLLKSALPSSHLRTIVASMHGYSLHTEVCTSRADFTHNGDLVVSASPEVHSRIETLFDELKQFSHLKMPPV